jgi:hypothetical protein
VSAEGKGLDFVLEVAVRGDMKKDLVSNVQRYARLGIPEYFAYEPLTPRLSGFRLERSGTYSPIVPQGGRWGSAVLGLELGIEARRIRFFAGTAPLPEADELIANLSKMLDDIVQREQRLLAELEEERERAEEERGRAEEERGRAEEARGRAEEARGRAERLAEKLRKLGVDPDAD